MPLRRRSMLRLERRQGADNQALEALREQSACGLLDAHTDTPVDVDRPSSNKLATSGRYRGCPKSRALSHLFNPCAGTRCNAGRRLCLHDKVTFRVPKTDVASSFHPAQPMLTVNAQLPTILLACPHARETSHAIISRVAAYSLVGRVGVRRMSHWLALAGFSLSRILQDSRTSGLLELRQKTMMQAY